MNLFQDARASLDHAEERKTSLLPDKTENRLSLILSGWNNFEADFEILAATLDAVGEVYPFVKVAVLPFKVAVTVELKRRQNDKKILALFVTMRDMMSVLAQYVFTPQVYYAQAELRDTAADRLLRLKKPAREQYSETIRDIFQQRMEDVGFDVKTCATTCDAFQSKRKIIRALKSISWEQTLTDFATKFEEHRIALQTFLTVLINSSVEHMNEVLASAFDTIKSVDSKINKALLLPFDRLQSEQERSIQQYVQVNGGQDALLENNRLIRELLSRYDDDQSLSTEQQDKLVQELRDDIRKDLGDLLQGALGISSNLFDALSTLMEITVRREGDHIVGSVLSGLAGPAKRVVDPDVRKIWSGMGWKWSVSAQDLVMSLKEYYTDSYASLAVRDGGEVAEDEDGEARNQNTHAPGIRQSDAWTLKHINVQGTHPLLEAIDRDVSSVHRDGVFPTGWLIGQLLGFPLALKYYSLHIQQKLQFILDISPRVLPANEKLVKSASQWYLHIKRSLAGARFQPFKDIPWDEELFGKFKGHIFEVENKMAKALSTMKWFIDSSSTVALLVGSGQLENNLLILMYLISGRLVEAMRAACLIPLGELELADLQSCVVMISKAMYTRLDEVKALCAAQNKSESVAKTLSNFASGLYYYLEYPLRFHHSRYGRSLIESQQNPLPGDRAMFEIAGSDTPVETGSEILALDAYVQVFAPTPVVAPAPTASPFWNVSWQGTYTPRPPPGPPTSDTGWSLQAQAVRFGDIQLSISSENSSISGTWSSVYGTFQLEGKIKDNNLVTIIAKYQGEHASYRSRRFEGILNDSRDTILGAYYLHAGSNPLAELGESSGERARRLSPRTESQQYRSSRRADAPFPSHADRTTYPSWRGEEDIGGEREEEEERESSPQGPSLGTFDLRLCPTYYFLFRPPGEDFIRNKCKALWKFALNAVAHAVRIQIPRVTWEFLKARRDRRKRYIELYTKYYIDPNASAQSEWENAGPLTLNEVSELQTIELASTPNDLKFYWSIAKSVLRKKLSQQQRYICNDCGEEVFRNVKYRMLCDSCAESSDDSFEVCEACAKSMESGVIGSKKLYSSQETHVGTHNMLQIHRALDDRTASEHHLQAQELLNPGTTEFAHIMSSKRPPSTGFPTDAPGQCFYGCGRSLLSEFWACIECDKFVACCYHCNEHGKKMDFHSQTSTHTWLHTMVRFPAAPKVVSFPISLGPETGTTRRPSHYPSRIRLPSAPVVPEPLLPRSHSSSRSETPTPRRSDRQQLSREQYTPYYPYPYPYPPPPPPFPASYWQSSPPPDPWGRTTPYWQPPPLPPVAPIYHPPHEYYNLPDSYPPLHYPPYGYHIPPPQHEYHHLLPLEHTFHQQPQDTMGTQSLRILMDYTKVNLEGVDCVETLSEATGQLENGREN
ncbi:hypothetical protein BT96DRAFT_1004725 [Gymnopus androsaceus JB14]|uniref:Uncharacterized protein n=1 Tax=Gymnopus androsaceus JB14 TaxID=1447944 RepID=A0A6A4GQ04_9AGAR|nr:hypothetical protein BT96DRAFT_1004725 [Gymnopus androsaceus JB14]